jgi:hypothetical protein
LIAADYPFLDVFWTMLVFFVWVAWFMLLFRVIGDLFRRDDLSGLGKTGWLIFAILLPFLGVFIYLITQNDGMTQREIDRVQTRRAQYDEQIRAAAGGGATSEIEKAKQLLDSGAITQAEFDALKQKALA